MRIVFLFFIFIFSQHPPYLKGDYVDTYHGMIGASWHFEKDGTFTYSEANCEGGRVGNGIYKLDGDSVHFIFQRSITSNIRSRLEAIKQRTEVTGWALDFQLRDRETNEDVIFAPIVVKDPSGNILKTANSDIDGKATLKLPGYNGIVFITVQSPDYSAAELKLEIPGSYSIKGAMSQTFGPAGVREGTRYDYRLLSVNKKGMQWQTTLPDTTMIIDVKKYNKQ